MKFGLDKWLLGQCGREDSVGKLARYWVNESGAGRIADHNIWFAELEKDSEWSTTVFDAKKEHAVAVDYLSRGKSAPTFPKWFASEESEKQMEQSFATHKGQTKLSADAYLRRLHFGLLKEIEKRALIYLDTNHWVNLCHVLVNSRHAKNEYADILFLLDDLAKHGRILCPVSFPLFQELMKQSNSETRLATAELMQAFSGGVCFQYPHRLQILELRQVLLRYVLGDAAPDLKEWIWTKVGYVTGELLPSNKAFSEEHNNLIRKVSIDGMWSLPLEHLAESDPKEFSDDAERILATATNTDAAWYREEKLPFEEVLAREQGYFVSRLLDDLRQIIREIWRDYPEYRDTSKLPSTDWINSDSKVWTQPSIRVLAGINAALMVSTKKFTINDILDFQHAALAVPHCDALFCDHPLAHNLINPPLEFGKVYETAILDQPDEIKKYLQSLS